MPATDNHLSLAAHNIDVLIHLSAKPDFCDWMTITACYSAIHLIEAMFYVEDGAKIRDVHCHGHGPRKLALQAAYPTIFKKYRPLYDAASVARYITKEGAPDQPFTCYYPIGTVCEKMIKSHFAGVVRGVKTIIGDKVNYMPIEEKFKRCIAVLDKR